MVNEEYAIAMSETLDILNHTAKEDVNKISAKFMKYLNDNASKKYKPNLDHSKKISEMQLKEKTKIFLAIIYRQFWCDGDKKKEFDNTLKNNEIKYQSELREKYNPDNLFKNKVSKIETLENSVAMVEYKESILTKIKNWFRRSF